MDGAALSRLNKELDDKLNQCIALGWYMPLCWRLKT
jgi:hypothetical protein